MKKLIASLALAAALVGGGMAADSTPASAHGLHTTVRPLYWSLGKPCWNHIIYGSGYYYTRIICHW